MAEPASKVQEIIIEGVVSGFSTVIGVFLGALLALKTYRTNQWWDAKLKVYLEGMNLWEELQKTCAAVSVNPGASRISGIQYEFECHDALSGFLEVRNKISSYLGRGRFNLSDKAYLMVRELAKETQQIPSGDGPLSTRMAQLLVVVNLFSHSFAEQARYDLQITPWNQRFQQSAKYVWLATSEMASRVFEVAIRWLLIIAFGQEEGEKKFAQWLVERSLPLTAQKP